MEKEVRKSKESCLSKGRFLYSCILLLRFGNILEVTTLVGAPSFGECTSIGNLPYNIHHLEKHGCVVQARLGKKKRKKMSNNMITLN
jgi:hypothetical protein